MNEQAAKWADDAVNHLSRVADKAKQIRDEAVMGSKPADGPKDRIKTLTEDLVMVLNKEDSVAIRVSLLINKLIVKYRTRAV